MDAIKLMKTGNAGGGGGVSDRQSRNLRVGGVLDVVLGSGNKVVEGDKSGGGGGGAAVKLTQKSERK
jgi:hypothetical protein